MRTTKIVSFCVLNLLLALLIGCSSTNQLSGSFKKEIKTVQLSTTTFFRNTKIKFKHIVDSEEGNDATLGATINGGLLGGLISTAIYDWKILKRSDKIKPHILQEKISSVLDDSVYWIVEEEVYKQSLHLFKDFSSFNIVEDSQPLPDAKMIFECHSFGYIQKNYAVYVWPYVEVTCYIIKGSEINIDSLTDTQTSGINLSKSLKGRILWKEKASSRGDLIELKDIIQNPELVRKNFADASKATINVLFHSMNGIKAY